MVINGAYLYDEHEINETVVTEMDETTVSSEAPHVVKGDEDHAIKEAAETQRSVTPDVIPKFDKRPSYADVESPVTDTPRAIYPLVVVSGASDASINYGESLPKVDLNEKLAFRLTSAAISGNAFDEIVSAEDVRDTCIEIKEPNGKVYFVEQLKYSPERKQDTNEKDESIALEILDSMLQLEEKRDDEELTLEVKQEEIKQEVKEEGTQGLPIVDYDTHPSSDMAGVTNNANIQMEEYVDTNRTSTAVKPLENENNESDIQSINKDMVLVLENSNKLNESHSDIEPTTTDCEEKATNKNDPNDLDINQRELQPTTMHSSTEIPSATKPIFEIQTYDEKFPNLEPKHHTSSEGHQSNFKDRLTHLIGQHSETQSTVSGANTPSSRQSKSPTISSKRHSRSTSDLLELFQPDGLPPGSPGSTSDGSNVNGDPQNSKAAPGEIPKPPRFDPLLFNTIGSRSNTRSRPKLPATAQSIENEFDRAFKQNLAGPRDFDQVKLRRAPKSEALNKTPEVEAEEDDTKRMTSIRERLEKILGRGPPERVSYPQSYMTPVPDYPNAPIAQAGEVSKKTDVDNDSEIIHYRKPVRPFDTVHKQKVLFNDVLKSIIPDIRTSLHRTDSTASASAGHEDKV